MNRQGPSNQTMRLGFPPAAAGRSAIAAGKIGGWTGAPPPGVPAPASRPGVGLTFSQSVGGLSQPSTPLDMSEFPALGGQPQTNPAQAWNRLNTQSPQSRGAPSQQQHPLAPQASANQSQQQHEGFPAGHKDMFGAIDDYRIGGGVGASQQQNQVPPSSMDDFPALPRTSSGIANLDERSLGGLGGRPIMSSRLLPQMDSVLPQQGGVQLGEVEKKSMSKGGLQSLAANGAPGLTKSVPTALSQQLGAQSSHPSSAPGLTRPPQGVLSGLQKLTGSANGDAFSESLGVRISAAVAEDDRYGLGNLIGALRSESGESATLATGQDLTMLGLDLSQPDAPLWPSFASPFAELEAKAVEPEFQLPACYTVHNTQPVHSKIQSFSDETLFYIFYSMPRDIMQEVVVAELAARNWRYHMYHKLWMTKDPTGQVEQFSETAEKGVYIFFDPTTWERVRKEIILEYSQLDPRTTGTFVGRLGAAGL